MSSCSNYSSKSSSNLSTTSTSSSEEEEMLSLEDGLTSTYEGLELLLNNDYPGALASFHEYANESLYHSHYYALALWLKAYLSLELPEIEEAQQASEATIEFINEIRPPTIRDNFFMKLFLKNNFEDCSDEQLHAELCRVEQILFGTMMEFFVDQSLFVLLKVSYRLRTCYVTYKTFIKLLETHEFQSDISHINFSTGVKLGTGIFNLMFSLLPERIMAMLSIIGFKGSRVEGLQLLNESANESTSRSVFAKMILAGYETYMVPMFNIETTSSPDTERNVQLCLKKSENSIFFQLFKGRLAMMERKPETALKIFQKCQNVPFDLKQLLNLYSWEIMWCNALLGNWESASKECECLRRFCPWSTPSFLYMEAIFLLQHYECRLVDRERYPGFKDTEEAKGIMVKVEHLLSQVHQNVKRYAGRRIPVEKYVCEKTENYQRDKYLVCPGIELFLCWNQFIFIENRVDILEKVLEHLNLTEGYYSLELSSENGILLRLLKATCRRLIKDYSGAERELSPVLSHLKNVCYDKHLGPMVSLEMALIQMRLGEYDSARQWLKRSNDYPSYALELLVQIRGYSAYKHTRFLMKQHSG